MKIDYSIKPDSKYFLFTDVTFRQGVNHIKLALYGHQCGLSIQERIHHFALGLLKLIPIIGHCTSLIDTLLQRRCITHLILKSVDPFERGKEHGLLLKDRIRYVYTPILSLRCQDEETKTRAQEFENQIPQALKDELRGLAEGSGFSYNEVILIHSFLDAHPGKVGCTSMVIKKTESKLDQRMAAANHRITEENSAEFFEKCELFYKALQISENHLERVGILNDLSNLLSNPPINDVNWLQRIQQDLVDIQRILSMTNEEYLQQCIGLCRRKEESANLQKNICLTKQKIISDSIRRRAAMLETADETPANILKAANTDSTIQSIIFNTTTGEIELAFNEKYAANMGLAKITSDELFTSHDFKAIDSNDKNSLKVYRNLDWPWYFLGQETILLNRQITHDRQTVSVTWPGYIGSLSGMNNKGLTINLNQCGEKHNPHGMPNPLLFTHMLDTCEKVSEAEVFLDQKLQGSSGNVIMADKTSAKSYELNSENFECVGSVA